MTNKDLPTLTADARTFFLNHYRDRGNWSGVPLMHGNSTPVLGEREDRGLLTACKRAGLLTTSSEPNPDPDTVGALVWIEFSELGLAYGASHEGIGPDKLPENAYAVSGDCGHCGQRTASLWMLDDENVTEACEGCARDRVRSGSAREARRSLKIGATRTLGSLLREETEDPGPCENAEAPGRHGPARPVTGLCARCEETEDERPGSVLTEGTDRAPPALVYADRSPEDREASARDRERDRTIRICRSIGRDVAEQGRMIAAGSLVKRADIERIVDAYHGPRSVLRRACEAGVLSWADRSVLRRACEAGVLSWADAGLEIYSAWATESGVLSWADARATYQADRAAYQAERKAERKAEAEAERDAYRADLVTVKAERDKLRALLQALADLTYQVLPGHSTVTAAYAALSPSEAV